MIGFLRAILSVILSVLCPLTSCIFGDYNAPFEPKDPESVKATFAVISDVHMTDHIMRTDRLDIGLYDMANAEYPLDALVMTGDITNNGTEVQYQRLKSCFDKYTPADNIIMAVGNHDVRTQRGSDAYDENPELYAEKKELFVRYNKEIAGRDIDRVYYSTVVNGFTFIVLGSEAGYQDFAYISPAQLNWLDAQLKIATADGKPAFVISHWPINNTHGLPETWGEGIPQPDDGGLGKQSDEVAAILKKYDNVFYITGHLHLGFTNDGQESFYGYNSVEKDGTLTRVNVPGFMAGSTSGRVSLGTGYVFEVYENNVLIRARSFYSGVWYTLYDYDIPLV